MSRLLIAMMAAVVALSTVATPAHAIFPHRQRVVVRQQVVVQKQVQVVQRVRVQQVQAVYAQPVVVQQVQAYSQPVCYPQAQLVAPVYSQQIGSQCLFAK